MRIILRLGQMSCDWICRTDFAKSEAEAPLFPLPGGEGQGEGERQN